MSTPYEPTEAYNALRDALASDGAMELRNAVLAGHVTLRTAEATSLAFYWPSVKAIMPELGDAFDRRNRKEVNTLLGMVCYEVSGMETVPEKQTLLNWAGHVRRYFRIFGLDCAIPASWSELRECASEESKAASDARPKPKTKKEWEREVAQAREAGRSDMLRAYPDLGDVLAVLQVAESKGMTNVAHKAITGVCDDLRADMESVPDVPRTLEVAAA